MRDKDGLAITTMDIHEEGAIEEDITHTGIRITMVMGECIIIDRGFLRGGSEKGFALRGELETRTSGRMREGGILHF
jgi:hypothetical protein